MRLLLLRYYSEYLPVILQFSMVVESEDFLWFQLYPINCSSSKKSTTTPYFFKTNSRLQHFWKPDSDNFENPTPTILKTRLRQFWKPDSDNFENPTPTILKTRLRQFWKPDSDNFENPTPTILKTRLRQFWKPDSDNFENPTPTILKTRLRQFWKNDFDNFENTTAQKNVILRLEEKLFEIKRSIRRGIYRFQRYISFL